MHWTVDNDREFYDIDELCDYLFDPDNYDDEDDFEEWINDCYYDRKVTIGGYEFTPYEIIRGCNDSVYEDLKDEWRNDRSEYDRHNYYSELQNMDDGDSEYYNGYEVCFYFDEEEEDEEEDDEDEDSYSDLCAEEDSVEGQISMDDYIKDLVCNFQKI